MRMAFNVREQTRQNDRILTYYLIFRAQTFIMQLFLKENYKRDK